MARRIARPLVATSLAAGVLFSCGKDSPTGPEGPGAPSSLAVVGGGGQHGEVGAALAQPVSVRVLDAKGAPVPGALVSFTVARGGGGVAPAQASAGADGVAQATWTLGTSTADSQRVMATVRSSASGPVLATANIVAKADPAAAASVVKAGGDGQTALAGAPLADSLVVRVVDRFGNGVAGTTVSFAASGGSLSPASVASDSAGFARTRWTLGTRVDSAQRVTASAGTLPALTFAAQARVAPTTTPAKVSGDGQSGAANQPLPDSLAVSVKLADGRPVAGAKVTWTVSEGNGHVSPAESITDAAGHAATQWVLGSTPSNSVVAAIAGAGSATFSARADTVDRMSVTIAPDSAIVARGSTRQFTATATDSLGRVVAGATVGWFSTSTGVAQVSSSGLVQGVAAGTAKILVTYRGKSDTALVTVTAPVDLTGITIVASPSSPPGGRAYWIPGDSVRLTVRASYSDGSVGAPPPAVFTGTAEVGTLRTIDSATAVVRFVREGVYYASVQAGGKYASASFTSYIVPTWVKVALPTTAQILGVWGRSASDIFAVGGGGTILHFDGSTWSQMASGTTGTISAIWPTADGRLYARGGSTGLLRYDGAAWTAVLYPPASPYGSDYTYVLSDTRAIAMGGGSTADVSFWDGTTWTKTLAGVAWPSAVWMASDGTAYVGESNFPDHGYYWDGSTWTHLTSSTQLPGRVVTFVGRTPDNFWVQNSELGSCCTWTHFSGFARSDYSVRDRNAQVRALWYSNGFAFYRGEDGRLRRNDIDDGITAGAVLWSANERDVYMVTSDGLLMFRQTAPPSP